MTERLESIITKSFDRKEGWEKLFDKTNDKLYRALRIGNTISCNDDLIKDHSLKDKISTILNTKNINYSLNEVDTKLEFSYQIQIDELNYDMLKSQYN